MPPVYRGEIKMQGRTLRGWIANAADAAERVAFDLVIDNEERGHYVADRPYLALERYHAFGDGAHGFALQLDREWISGATQNVALAVRGAPSGVELHAALGPVAGAYFDDDAEPPRKRTPQESEALRELAECRRLRRGAETEDERARFHRRYFEILGALSAAETRENAWRHSILLARECYDLGRFQEAADVAGRVLASEPDNFRALFVRGRSLIGLNRAGEAHGVFVRALAQQPDNPGARFYAQMTETLALGEPGTETLAVGEVKLDKTDAIHLADRIARLPFDWVRLQSGAASADHAVTLNQPLLHQVGCVTLPSGGGHIAYWRRDALVGLAESGLVNALDEGSVSRWRPFFSQAGAASNGKRKAALVARDNAIDADRVDADLAAIASEYRAAGYEPAIVNLGGAGIAAADLSHAHIEETAAALRRYLLSESIAIVHAVSGTGYTVADALAFTNIPFVYGVHFLWDMLGDSEANDSDDNVQRARPEFDYVLSRAAAIYATSTEMRDMVEAMFSVRCSILPVGREGAA